MRTAPRQKRRTPHQAKLDKMSWNKGHGSYVLSLPQALIVFTGDEPLGVRTAVHRAIVAEVNGLSGVERSAPDQITLYTK